MHTYRPYVTRDPRTLVDFSGPPSAVTFSGNDIDTSNSWVRSARRAGWTDSSHILHGSDSLVVRVATVDGYAGRAEIDYTFRRPVAIETRAALRMTLETSRFAQGAQGLDLAFSVWLSSSASDPFGESANYSRAYEDQLAGSQRQKQDEMTMLLLPDEFDDVNDGCDFASITALRVIVVRQSPPSGRAALNAVLYPEAAGAVEVCLDVFAADWECGQVPLGLGCDDGQTPIADPQQGILEALDQRATCYVLANQLDAAFEGNEGSGFMSLAQLQGLDANGHALREHGTTSFIANDGIWTGALSREQSGEEWRRALEIFDARGFATRDVVAYPGGRWTAEAIDALQDGGVLVARRVGIGWSYRQAGSNTAQQTINAGVPLFWPITKDGASVMPRDRYQIPSIIAQDGAAPTAIADKLAIVERAADHGFLCSCLWHVTRPESEGCDGVNNCTIEETWEEFLEGLQGLQQAGKIWVQPDHIALPEYVRDGRLRSSTVDDGEISDEFA